MKYNCRSLLVSFFFLIIFPTQYLWGYETSKTEEKTIPFHSGGKVVLKVNDGDIHIRTWERNEVVIRMTKHAWSSSRHKAEKRLQDLRVEIREDEDLLTIRELHRNDNFMIFDLFSNDFWQGQWHKKQIDFELDVPRQTNIQIDIDDGDIQIEGIEGKLWIESDAGNINATTAVTAAYFAGDGANLTNVPAGAATSITDGTSNVDIPTTDGNVTVGVGGTADVLIVTKVL